MMTILRELVEALPGMKVLLIAPEGEDASAAVLREHLSCCGGELMLNRYPAPLQVPSREFEAVVIDRVMHRHPEPLKLLKQAYRSLENSGILIIIDSDKTDAVIALLEACDYRTPNIIDLSSDCHVVVAKKLHMWGNGL